MATDEEVRGGEEEKILDHDDETKEIDAEKSIDSNDIEDEERGTEKDSFIDNDENKIESQGEENESFVDNDTDDENSGKKHDLIMNWIMVKDWYKQPLKPGERSSFARRVDTKFVKQFQRAAIIFGALFKIIAVATLIGYSPSVSIIRTVPTPENNYDFGELSERFSHNESRSCDEISDEPQPDFIISFSNSTTSLKSSCPDEGFDEGLRMVVPYVMILLVVAWFVLKVFLSQVQETAKRTKEADIGSDYCLYNGFVSCFRMIGMVIYQLMDIALQNIIAPIALLNFQRESSAIWIGYYEFMLLVITIGTFASTCAVITSLVLFEAAVRFICCARCCGDWRYPIGSLGPKVGYYLLVVCLFIFVVIVIPLKILALLEFVKENNTCGYDITSNDSGCKVNFFLDFIRKIVGDIFGIPREWWPSGLPAFSLVVSTFNILGAFSIAPSILLSFVGVLANILDGLVHIYQRLCGTGVDITDYGEGIEI